MVVEVKAGPGLDRAVAEAVGDPYPRFHDWEHTGLSEPEVSVYRCAHCGELELDGEAYDPKAPCVKHYSTDLNAAFSAAEAVGLFRRYGYCQASGQYVVSETVPVASWKDVIAHASTPALAICAAVLALPKP